MSKSLYAIYQKVSVNEDFAENIIEEVEKPIVEIIGRPLITDRFLETQIPFTVVSDDSGYISYDPREKYRVSDKIREIREKKVMDNKEKPISKIRISDDPRFKNDDPRLIPTNDYKTSVKRENNYYEDNNKRIKVKDEK